MKASLPIVIFIVANCFWQLLIAQSTDQQIIIPQNNSVLSFETQISFSKDTIQKIRNISNEGRWYSEESQYAKTSVFSKPQVRVESGNVIIEFQLDSISSDGFYMIELVEFKRKDGKGLFELYPERKEGDFGEVSTKTGLNKAIIIAEGDDNMNLKYLEGDVSIVLKAELFDHRIFRSKFFRSKIQCNQRLDTLKLGLIKDFKYKLLTGAVGGVVYLLGVERRTRWEEVYDDDYRTQRTKGDAEEFYDDASKKRKKEIYLKNAGIGIASAGAIWALGHWLIHAERKSTYKANCPSDNRIGILPYYQIGDDFNPQGYAGIRLQLSF